MDKLAGELSKDFTFQLSSQPVRVFWGYFFFASLIDASVAKMQCRRDIVSLAWGTYCGPYVRGNVEYF